MYVCCCIKREVPALEATSLQRHYLLKFFEKYYAPFLMKDYMRCLVLLVFSGWLCLSISFIDKLDIGLDKRLSVSKNSYVLDYFDALANYSSVGPPVYFVIKSGYNYSSLDDQNSLCSVAYCNRESLMAQITDASKFSNRTYIAHPPIDWLDNYIHWANDQTKCCRVYVNDSSKFCASSIESALCQPCKITDDEYFRPRPEQFNSFLLNFLKEIPSPNCPIVGNAGFVEAVQVLENYSIGATYYLTYHTPLKTTEDYIESLKWARKIADNITRTLNSNNNSDSKAEVFPYSAFYVYYEQYLTATQDFVLTISLSISAIFLLSIFLMGLDLHSALIMVFTVLMIFFDLLGFMFFWNISLNAVSFVNLAVGVAVSIKFCAHIIHSFAFNSGNSKVNRARIAVAQMGDSVIYGVTLTKLIAVVVIASFTTTQILKIFFMRMFLGITLIGIAHGLIFLPVVLSIIGPSRKKKELQNPQTLSENSHIQAIEEEAIEENDNSDTNLLS